MSALIMGLGVLAVISLAALAAFGTVKAATMLLAAAAGAVRHEMMMRPRERYYRMGGAL